MTTYHISCHCQANILKYTVPEGEEPGFKGNGVCDCSHCFKRRTVWVFAPKGSLEVVKGVDGLQEYRFGSKKSGHQFCPTCGTHVLGSKFDKDANTMFNARAVRTPGFTLWQHSLKLYSGIERPPQYTYTELSHVPGAKEYLDARLKSSSDSDSESADDDKGESKGGNDKEVYVGSCHCKAIQFAVLCEPLDSIGVTDCACSICLGNGVLWIYPGRRNTYFHPPASTSEPYRPPDDLVFTYTFGDSERKNEHVMCKSCGGEVYEHTRAPGADGADSGKGHYGLNAALLTRAPDYLGDVLGLKDDQEEFKGKRMGGMERQVEPEDYGPKYELRL